MNKKQRNAHKKKIRIKQRRKERKARERKELEKPLGMNDIMEMMKLLMGGNLDMEKLMKAAETEGGIEEMLQGQDNPLAGLFGGEGMEDMDEDKMAEMMASLFSENEEAPTPSEEAEASVEDEGTEPDQQV
jgi:hypothetical protein